VEGKEGQGVQKSSCSRGNWEKEETNETAAELSLKQEVEEKNRENVKDRKEADATIEDQT